MKITDKFISDFFDLPYRTIADWKQREMQDWRYKIYTFLKAINPTEFNSNNKISSRELSMATRIFSLNNLFGEFNPATSDDIGRMRDVWVSANCFNYRGFDLKEFEEYKLTLINIVANNNDFAPIFKNKFINFITKLDINSYIIVWDYFNNCIEEIK